QDRRIYQALLFCEQDDEAFLSQHPELNFIRWHDLSCDVLPGGGSKAVGINKIMKASGLSKEHSFAFGDGFNDIEMLQEAGTGIAMGNAVEPLKQVADHMTAKVEEDGIFKALQYFELL